MPQCKQCGAPLPKSNPQCRYCGTATDIDLDSLPVLAASVPEASRTCPRCSITLRTIDISGQKHFYIERCDTCMGLFFDPGELDALLTALVSNVFCIDAQRLNKLIEIGNSREEPLAYIKCPVCGNLMNRVNFGARSGIVVDTCNTHGMWLDGGELKRLLDWRKAGGQLFHEQIEKEKALREEEKKKKQEQEHMRRYLSATEQAGYGSVDVSPLITLSKVLGKLFFERS